MYYSRYNLLLKMKENPEFPFAIMNSLAGSFDLVRQPEYEKLEKVKNGGSSSDPQFADYLLSRGYLYRTREEEEAELERRWPEFQKALHETEPQVLLVPTYSCNLACTYCYQNGIKQKTQLMTREVADAFFDRLAEQFPTTKPFITLFGGEALNAAPRQMEIVDYIVKRAAEGGYAIAAVTNGYDLAEYLDILQQARIKEIQVTVDGPRSVHDRRRHTANGKGTYDKIMAGLTEAIRRGVPINLRAVVDKSNFTDLVPLAEDLEARGWLDLPASRFKTQIGRNYELFECYASPEHLLDQAEHWALFLELAEQHPILKKFHRPEFKGINHLVQSGELYLPSYDTCPAAKTEWVFDLYGDIYGCTATTGQDEYKLGTFYPVYALKQKEVKEWQERSILSIPECRECEVGLICGGGCGAIAKDRRGKVLAPDCHPIKEILNLGLQYYGDELLTMGH
ncbi:anaerobic sulfatase-maturating enzyme [Peptococcaceae bacterium CEB3]|nr:anaerobic sulfatase-maturating enzyme [Peptococcaceae bacterium CEB3]